MKKIVLAGGGAVLALATAAHAGPGKKIVLAGGGAVLALATAAHAGPGMRGMDSDGDGVVALAEVRTKSAAMFERMDANQDGVLNAADREARRAQKFDRMDANDDGSISRSEYAEMSGKWREKRGGRADGEKMHRGGKRGHRGGGMKMMRGADTNGDDAVSRAEFDAAVTRHFAMMDADNDGRITDAERKAAHQRLREMHRQQRQADSAG